MLKYQIICYIIYKKLSINKTWVADNCSLTPLSANLESATASAKLLSSYLNVLLLLSFKKINTGWLEHSKDSRSWKIKLLAIIIFLSSPKKLSWKISPPNLNKEFITK